ncbi:MAG TPA: potassium channel family protein [Pirellulales bacterium]|jgi:hypothetical protein|nr:potassium channel family protein [Pirellulales bacterium]
MHVLIGIAGVALIAIMLTDALETIVIPRRVTHNYRFVRLFYQGTWRVWRVLALYVPPGRRREAMFSLFGPLSLLALLSSWVLSLMLGFALLHWALQTPVNPPEPQPTFATYVYMSGETFVTLGYGDVTPANTLGRMLAVSEAGMGLGFLALVIGYLPVIYQTFSRREVLIGLLDARGGSPPSAAQLLVRMARSGDVTPLDTFLAECERWSAELLESHLSFPVLAYYRSQHDNQSWLAALTAILDMTAIIAVGLRNYQRFQAELTFAISRHAAVDLALVTRTPPFAPQPDRLPQPAFLRLSEQLREAGLGFEDEVAAEAKLTELRGTYEPFVNAISHRLMLSLPPIVPLELKPDNWQRSAWMKPAPEIGNLSVATTAEEHFS